MTGISDQMVSSAPSFKEIAEKVFTLLQGQIFVAHNVQFDYSFIKAHLKREGYQLHCSKLCTVRLSRQILPGLPSYSLGKLRRSLHWHFAREPAPRRRRQRCHGGFI
jgi:DNA polymerase-3 subunit epsilon